MRVNMLLAVTLIALAVIGLTTMAISLYTQDEALQEMQEQMELIEGQVPPDARP